MTQSGAIARAQTLRAALLDHGVRQVSIEVVQGRPGGPNGGWWTTTFVGSMGHHIASRRTQGLTPFLSLIKTGRADLPGPIANGYGGFDKVARIVCMGWANHPGSGGPWTVEAGVIPINNGRPYLFGWEFEGGINPADWTDSYREFMGRCHAGTLAWLGRSERSHLEHKTWAPTRKVDRLGYSLSGAQAEAKRYLGGSSVTTHQHTPPPSKTLPSWFSQAQWDAWVEASNTNPDTAHYDFYRYDWSWIYGRVIRPMQLEIERLQKRMETLEAREVTGSGLRRGDTVRLT